MKKDDSLSDDRENNKEGLNFLRSRAYDWVLKALVRKKDGREFTVINLSERSFDELEGAAYRGLVNIEEQVEANPKLHTETEKNEAAKLADNLLRGQLVTLIEEGQDVFLDMYRKILKKDKPCDEVAASGIRVMAHELGIETSLRAQMRTKRHQREKTDSMERKR